MIINLFAGPGAGKSTMAAGLFYELKMRKVKCELALEYAKDLVWEERFNTLKNQPYLFGKQYHRIQRLMNNGLEYIVTDSPILLCCLYAGSNYPPSFTQSIVDIFKLMPNRNFFINRVKEYDPNGRTQKNIEEAITIDHAIRFLLLDNKIEYEDVDGSAEGLRTLVDLLEINNAQIP